MLYFSFLALIIYKWTAGDKVTLKFVILDEPEFYADQLGLQRQCYHCVAAFILETSNKIHQ